jgi:hypothetical protein
MDISSDEDENNTYLSQTSQDTQNTITESVSSEKISDNDPDHMLFPNFFKMNPQTSKNSTGKCQFCVVSLIVQATFSNLTRHLVG